MMRSLLTAFALALPLMSQAKPVTLKPLAIENPEELPLAARHLIADRLPEALVGTGFSAELRRGKLLVDTTGDCRRNKTITGSKLLKLKDEDGTTRSVFVFRILDNWYAASASCLVGKFDRRSIIPIRARLPPGPDSFFIIFCICLN